MQPSPEIARLITGYFASFTIGDPGWVDRHVLRGDELRLIGTNPDEWLNGVNAHDLFRREAAAATGALSAEVSEVEAYSAGEVGWGAGRVRFSVEDGRVALARFSAVFVQVDSEWLLVNSHTSIAVPDDEAFSEHER